MSDYGDDRIVTTSDMNTDANTDANTNANTDGNPDAGASRREGSVSLLPIVYKEAIEDIYACLEDMALPAVAAKLRQLKSSASTPSLRSRKSEVVPMTNYTPNYSGGNVKVVVRVRGFLEREIERGAECLVEMDPETQATKLLVPNCTDPANARTQSRKVVEEKVFTFDYSFWSHNPDDLHFAQQEDIYDTVGEEFLDHNFEGYHTCIFAYGQTGAGKSYTMMGTPSQPGLIPRTCEDLFQRIESNTSTNISYSVRVSYFEVYNEHVRDLLTATVPSANARPFYLKIRESPTEGPYIKDLTELPVKSYRELICYMKLGDSNRTIASTKMNDTSSRSHAVFTIMLKQIHHDITTDATTERVARIRLVDLAGSERAKATEATGARLREGSNINKSLTTLGRVIAALADPRHSRVHNGGKSKSKDVVPYRDSVLTWLLKDSLGGNSKTAMIACIAPSDYDETLSTLRYADQAKHIRTRATINQDSLSGAQRDAQIAELQNIIRELQMEKNQAACERRGREMSNSPGNSIRDEKLDEYQTQVERMQRVLEEEKLVSDSKIRQLTERNEALQLHLRLAVESLTNPITGILNSPKNKRKSKAKLASERNDSENDKENAAPTEDEEREEIDEDDIVDPVRNAKADAEALELQQQLLELLDDVAIFKRKLADDFERFSIPRTNISERYRRRPLHETYANF